MIFFKTELLHSHVYLPYSGYETGGLVWLTSELAVLGGSGRACMRRCKYIASFLLAKTDQPVESWWAGKECYSLLDPDFFRGSVFILNPYCQMAADCPPLPWHNHALCEYYPVGLHLRLWTMTIVWLILTFQILRILRTLLEAFVFLGFFSWIFSLLFSSPVPISGLILRIVYIFIPDEKQDVQSTLFSA